MISSQRQLKEIVSLKVQLDKVAGEINEAYFDEIAPENYGGNGGDQFAPLATNLKEAFELVEQARSRIQEILELQKSNH